MIKNNRLLRTLMFKIKKTSTVIFALLGLSSLSAYSAFAESVQVSSVTPQNQGQTQAVSAASSASSPADTASGDTAAAGPLVSADTQSDPSYYAFEHYTANPPLNQYGAVNVDTHVAENVQVPVAPVAAGGAKATPAALSSQWPALVPPQPQLNAKAYILMDAANGNVLAAYDGNKRMAPASTTKLMLLYIVQQELKSGRIHLDDMVTVPKIAWATGGSRMFLKPGSQVAVKDLIQGIIVDSGNDAAVTLATYMGGTQSAIVHLMNQALRSLGMHNTHFSDVMGLPAPAHFSTAYDLGKLAYGLINNYPEYYSLFSQKYFRYNGIRQANFNRLLFIYPYADGLKTGSTGAAGFSLVSSAKTPGNAMRLIAVVLGANSDNQVAALSKELLTYGFRFFEGRELYHADTKLSERHVWLGQSNTLAVGIEKALYVTIPQGADAKLKANMVFDDALKAPIVKGQKVGELKVTLEGKSVADVPVVAMADIAQGSFFKRLSDHIRLFFDKIF
ncbi:D-alanyl-D-alanine carboxypeptidase [Piscirickettsia salmonis]|nr:D-alanyl-D-alanine carboxypeptidase [Piscirickettsia salmonis]ERL63219.1 D-alanyl-D-alanine carboxypeptidase family protein [Piscirickettsia salmonis LF-89 = ATCC VR-1361]PEQ17672.1 D-alanyl-D-alanine carboxypeptidase [Piscirickettsia salmonis]